ncbi:hypothetical protein HBB16_01390 [Pseudonocardia sp. MCCB 268]|nr:hypothetical protein [Pseudonocardia cytotoxica]
MRSAPFRAIVAESETTVTVAVSDVCAAIRSRALPGDAKERFDAPSVASRAAQIVGQRRQSRRKTCWAALIPRLAVPQANFVAMSKASNA